MGLAFLIPSWCIRSGRCHLFLLHITIGAVIPSWCIRPDGIVRVLPCRQERSPRGESAWRWVGAARRPEIWLFLFLFPVSSFIFRERKQRPRRAQTETQPESTENQKTRLGRPPSPRGVLWPSPRFPLWALAAIPSWLIARGLDPLVVYPPQTPAGFIDPLVVNLSCGRS